MNERVIGTLNYPIPITGIDIFTKWVNEAYEGEAFLQDRGDYVEIVVKQAPSNSK